MDNLLTTKHLSFITCNLCGFPCFTFSCMNDIGKARPTAVMPLSWLGTPPTESYSWRECSANVTSNTGSLEQRAALTQPGHRRHCPSSQPCSVLPLSSACHTMGCSIRKGLTMKSVSHVGQRTQITYSQEHQQCPNLGVQRDLIARRQEHQGCHGPQVDLVTGIGEEMGPS